jgi:hypothetical protein
LIARETVRGAEMNKNGMRRLVDLDVLEDRCEGAHDQWKNKICVDYDGSKHDDCREHELKALRHKIKNTLTTATASVKTAG